jgi:hypothetical protein
MFTCSFATRGNVLSTRVIEPYRSKPTAGALVRALSEAESSRRVATQPYTREKVLLWLKVSHKLHGIWRNRQTSILTEYG